MDRNTISEALLAKYFSGQCNAEEKARVQAYLSSHDAHTSELMETEWSAIAENPPPRNTVRERSGYEKISKATAAPASSTFEFHMPYRIAASLILVATFTFLFYRYGGAIMTGFIRVEQMAVDTEPGMLKQVVLPDGSAVWLNASSRLSFPEKFGSTREVLLEGEAFFKVKPDKKKPFIIRTGNFFTTVLGTSFNIKAYTGDKQIRVSVATGKVGVSVADTVLHKTYPLATLTRDQQITYFPETNSFHTEDVLPEHFNGWINGQLVFKRTDVMEVASTLSRWYNKKVEVSGYVPGMACTFTANFRTDTPLHDVLETLSITQKMRYSIVGEKVVMQVEKCQKKNNDDGRIEE